MDESAIQQFVDSIPDDTVPVFGYRAWHFHKKNYGGDFPLILRAIARQMWWSSDGPTYATCSHPDKGIWKGMESCPGPVPHFRCTCGCYAHHTTQKLNLWDGRAILGAVIGWGNSEWGVIRHGPEGWRAEVALPIAFVRPRVTSNGVSIASTPSSYRHYSTMDSKVPGMIEQLAYRLGARVFDTIGEMDYWVRAETPYASFWTPEDHRKYIAESKRGDDRSGL